MHLVIIQFKDDNLSSGKRKRGWVKACSGCRNCCEGHQGFIGKKGTYKGKAMLEFGKWALVGGFLDRDETLAEAIKREAFEEIGWKLKNIKPFKIVDNPNRPNDDGRQNVSFVFLAEPVTEKTKVSEEVSEVKWFDLDNLPSKKKIAFDFYDALQLYRSYLKKKFPIPVLG